MKQLQMADVHPKQLLWHVHMHSLHSGDWHSYPLIEKHTRDDMWNCGFPVITTKVSGSSVTYFSTTWFHRERNLIHILSTFLLFVWLLKEVSGGGAHSPITQQIGVKQECKDSHRPGRGISQPGCYRLRGQSRVRQTGIKPLRPCFYLTCISAGISAEWSDSDLQSQHVYPCEMGTAFQRLLNENDSQVMESQMSDDVMNDHVPGCRSGAALVFNLHRGCSNFFLHDRLITEKVEKFTHISCGMKEKYANILMLSGQVV